MMNGNSSPPSSSLPPNHPERTSSSPWKAAWAWFLLLAWEGFILLTLSTVPTWREQLEERWGEGVYEAITYGAAGLALLALLAYMIFRLRERRILPYVSLALVLAALRYVTTHWIVIPVEQIHFIEYGMVGFLSYNALRYHLRGGGLVAAALMLTYLFGMVDETIQGHLANRVGQQEDMHWNGLAGIMGLAVVVLSLRPRWIRGPSGRREARFFLVMLALALPVQGYFNSTIAQFGHLIHEKDLNVTFRSRLKPEALKAYDDHLDHFKSVIVPRLGKARGTVILPLVYDLIHEEATVHMFRYGRYLQEKKFFIAYKEYLIIQKYFWQFIEGTPLQPPPDHGDQLRAASGAEADAHYESPVAAHLITSFSAAQNWIVIALLEAGIIGGLVLLRRRPRRAEEQDERAVA